MSSHECNTIVVIDDDPAISFLYVEVLSTEGWRVTSFLSAAEAVSRLDESSLPDLLLVDYSMPEMDGGQFLQALRQRFPQLSQHTRVVGLSSLDNPEVFGKNFSSLIDDFCQKPFDIDDLVTMVRHQMKLTA